MKCAAAGPALLLISLTLTAQNGDRSPSQSMLFTPSSALIGCPVGMQAQQRSGEHFLVARNGQHIEGLAQRINLTLIDTHAARITSASLRVHGLTARNHLRNALSSRDSLSSDVTRSMIVQFVSSADNGVNADLVLPGLTAVTSIELVSMTYADGTLWTVSSEASCRAAPDLLMLISDR